jgi:hypothetical protein
MAEFTKGPWQVKSPHNRFRHSPYKTGTFEIFAGEVAICHWEHARTTGDMAAESEANANLIGAAPDMYGMLKILGSKLDFAEWGSVEHAEEILQEMITSYCGKITAIIDKAEGRG